MPMCLSFYGVVGNDVIVMVGVLDAVGVLLGVNAVVIVGEGVSVLEGVKLGVMDGVKLEVTKTVAVPVTDGV